MDEPLPDPDLQAPERTDYRAMVDGEEVGTGSLTLRADDDRTFVQAIEAEAYGRLKGSATITYRRRSGTLVAQQQRLELTDKGRHVLDETASFRDVQVPQIGGQLGPYSRSMVPVLGLATAFRVLPLQDRARFLPRVWVAAVVDWPLDIRVEGREKARVPAGDVDAWRIRLRPSLLDVAQALDELSAAVVPPIIAHVGVDGGRLLRLSFPTGPGRSDPSGVIEATAIA
ncbi:MAG: DUF3108 domain-containing protein [Solirubrobacteraceae bacterium]|nr:DUF3108 domain-containing protein [Solirubrobacteraceae bacterium]